jgi:hypothetical protein
MIENFAIVNNLQPAIFVAHRLMAARDINDAETPMPERNKIVAKEPAAIGAAMGNSISH